MTERVAGYRARHGFTLMELLVVIALIASVLAVAAPRFLPTILYSTHEGAARHLANYGRAAFAHATLEQETLTVKVDLDRQAYWCERIPPPPEEEQDVESEDGLGAEEDSVIEELAMEELSRSQDADRSEEGRAILDEQSRRMRDRFDGRAKTTVAERAARIKHDERYLPPSATDSTDRLGNGPGGGEGFEPEIVQTPLLTRTNMPDGVRIAAVEVAGVQSEKGEVAFKLTPLGLEADVKFWIASDDGDLFVVEWDAITQRTFVREDDA